MRTSHAIQLEYEYQGNEAEGLLRGAITLPNGQLSIGRSATCFLVLGEPTVSRVHLRLVVSDDDLLVEDPGSANGTLLNGAILRGSAQLRDRDELQIGSRLFRVKLVDRSIRSEPRTAPLEEAILADEDPTQLLQLDHLCARCGQQVLHQGSCPSCGLDPSVEPVSRTEQDHHSVSRQQRRCKVALHARYTGRTRVEGSVLNLSRSGVFFACKTFDEIGTRCRVELTAIDGDRAEFEGFVRHVIRKGHDRMSGMGIAFAVVDEAGVRWLAKQLLKSMKQR